MNHSRVGPQQLVESMWNESNKTNTSKYELDRRKNDLCCFWMRLGCVCTNYISARSIIMKGLFSGQIVE